MRIGLLVVLGIVAVVCLVALWPVKSYSEWKRADVEVTFTLNVSSTRIDMTDVTYEDRRDVSYWSYLMDYWTGSLPEGSVVPPDTPMYVGVMVYPQVSPGIFKTVPIMEAYFAYGEGVVIQEQISFLGDWGETYRVYMRIYWENHCDYHAEEYITLI